MLDLENKPNELKIYRKSLQKLPFQTPKEHQLNLYINQSRTLNVH